MEQYELLTAPKHIKKYNLNLLEKPQLKVLKQG